MPNAPPAPASSQQRIVRALVHRLEDAVFDPLAPTLQPRSCRKEIEQDIVPHLLDNLRLRRKLARQMVRGSRVFASTIQVEFENMHIASEWLWRRYELDLMRANSSNWTLFSEFVCGRVLLRSKDLCAAFRRRIDSYYNHYLNSIRLLVQLLRPCYGRDSFWTALGVHREAVLIAFRGGFFGKQFQIIARDQLSALVYDHSTSFREQRYSSPPARPLAGVVPTSSALHREQPPFQMTSESKARHSSGRMVSSSRDSALGPVSIVQNDRPISQESAGGLPAVRQESHSRSSWLDGGDAEAWTETFKPYWSSSSHSPVSPWVQHRSMQDKFALNGESPGQENQNIDHRSSDERQMESNDTDDNHYCLRDQTMESPLPLNSSSLSWRVPTPDENDNDSQDTVEVSLPEDIISEAPSDKQASKLEAGGDENSPDAESAEDSSLNSPHTASAAASVMQQATKLLNSPLPLSNASRRSSSGSINGRNHAESGSVVSQPTNYMATQTHLESVTASHESEPSEKHIWASRVLTKNEQGHDPFNDLFLDEEKKEDQEHVRPLSQSNEEELFTTASQETSISNSQLSLNNEGTTTKSSTVQVSASAEGSGTSGKENSTLSPSSVHATPNSHLKDRHQGVNAVPRATTKDENEYSGHTMPNGDLKAPTKGQDAAVHAVPTITSGTSTNGRDQCDHARPSSDLETSSTGRDESGCAQSNSDLETLTRRRHEAVCPEPRKSCTQTGIHDESVLVPSTSVRDESVRGGPNSDFEAPMKTLDEAANAGPSSNFETPTKGGDEAVRTGSVSDFTSVNGTNEAVRAGSRSTLSSGHGGNENVGAESTTQRDEDVFAGPDSNFETSTKVRDEAVCESRHSDFETPTKGRDEAHSLISGRDRSGVSRVLPFSEEFLPTNRQSNGSLPVEESGRLSMTESLHSQPESTDDGISSAYSSAGVAQQQSDGDSDESMEDIQHDRQQMKELLVQRRREVRELKGVVEELRDEMEWLREERQEALERCDAITSQLQKMRDKAPCCDRQTQYELHCNEDEVI